MTDRDKKGIKSSKTVTQLRSRPAIRQFFLAADQNPDEVITQILRRAIDSL